MHGDLAADRRQHRQRAVQPLDQAGAVGQPGQRVVMGEEADAAVGLLLFPRAPVPGDGRDGEGQSREQAEHDRCNHKCRKKLFTRRRFIDVGGDHGDRLAIDACRNKRFGEMQRQVRRIAAFDVDDRLAFCNRVRRPCIEFRNVDQRDLVVIGNELGIALAVKNRVAEDVARLSVLEEGNAGGRRFFARSDAFEIGDAFAEVARPALRFRHGKSVEQVIGGELDRQPGTRGEKGERKDEKPERSTKRDVGKVRHWRALVRRTQGCDLFPGEVEQVAIVLTFGGPFGDDGSEGPMRDVEVTRRGKNNRALGIGF